MIDPKALLADLKGQVKALESDLRLYGVTDSTAAAELEREWQAARDAQRTAATYEMWREDRLTQVAVAWVLGTVFVRFCEDNRLIEYPVIAGPGDRVALARERQGKFFEESPALTDRDWIIEGFNALSVSPVAAGLFAWHNPMWSVLPSHDAAKVLLAFWRDQDANAQIIHDFTDETWNTRFLGDLYQDLSEHAKKTYALLQTPEFVEEFILTYTLDPAIKEFGLEPEPPYGHPDLPRRLRVIDPACGSGHFLLGAFRRLLAAWQDQSGDTDKWVLIAHALESVHGVDKNPFAAAIARFRLMLAAMQAGGIKQLSAKVELPLNIAVGDSLLHGYAATGKQGELQVAGDQQTYTYRTEDIDDYIKSVHILAFGTYHAVFANPPYITVKDKQESEAYRDRYASCYREYSLSVPFAERIFKLAIRGSLEGAGAGYTGQITANSFMKREFGKKLIEEFFSRLDLTHVIDTSGAFIPSHGTPTVILFGRWQYPRQHSTIRAVLGVRGEPGQPSDPACGLVWRAIVGQLDNPGSESEWVTVVDLRRDQLAKHPWSLSGGGAKELREFLEHAPGRLSRRVASIGFMAVTREDDAYFIGPGAARRMGLDSKDTRPVSGGACLRDWRLSPNDSAVFPYSEDGTEPRASKNMLRHLWRYEQHLGARKALSGTQEDRGLPWYSYSDFHSDRWDARFKIGFAFVATNNQFVSVPAGNLLIRTAPMIKLLEGTTEDDQHALLGLLNTSATCFWLQQVSHNKGEGGGARVDAGYAAMGSEAWKNCYEFTGTKLEQLPLPGDLPLQFGRELDGLAQQLASFEPSAVCAEEVPVRDRLDLACEKHRQIRGQIIALQEELDWDVYRRYGLLDSGEAAELIAKPNSVPQLKLGERAFEIVLDAGFDARLAALAEALNSAMPEPTAAKLQAAEAALRQVFDYRRKRTREAEVRAAEAAVRVARWLAAPEDSPSTLADAATRMLRSWGWADRALTVIARADTSRVPRLGGVYAKLWDSAAARRGGLDQAFASKLAAWTEGSGTTSELLLVENVMERIAKPVAKSRLPLVLVLDGMSVAAGCDLAAELTDGGLWLEAGRHEDGREPVLATVPSVTSISRTSLLTGKLRSGGQPEEKAGFAAFWGNQKARLFHKGDLAADPGQRLNPQVRDAILDPDTIVGVVLNTIDDMLNPGRQGNESHWEVDQVAYLKPVLDEARRAGRPVIFTADHGHVLDRRRPIHPAQSESARYRTGTPGDGEITVRGPRVLVPGGEVVAAVDEGIHYLPKKAGYHGGAAPAEVVVPVIVLLPSSSLVPDGWYAYEANGHRPVWWDAPQAEPAAPSPVKPSRRPAAAHVEEPDDALFGVRDVMAPAEAGQPAPVASKKATASSSSLGSQVVASGRLASQRQFARRAPDDDRIARLIDGLDRAGRKATIGEAARIAGEPAVRMSGYLAQVARLLNVDGYPVIRTIDDGRTVELNTELLKQQFLGNA